MPIPQVVRIDPLDLKKNTAVGVSLPFNGPAVFNSVYSTKEQIKSNIINLLLTNKGERIMNPNFGTNLRDIIFEGNVDNIALLIQEKITSALNIYIPQVRIDNIDVGSIPDSYELRIDLKYTIIISGDSEQIIIDFQ
jgi:phage baseplate assembly protein W